MNRYWMTETIKGEEYYGSEYYPGEIAEALCDLCKIMELGYKPDEQDYEDCKEALYQLMAICENDYNSEYYRTFYKVLAKAAYTIITNNLQVR